MNAPSRNAFPAKFPGSCLCGARFQAGARIYWDASVRRATGCPACAPRKAKPGTPHTLANGLVVRFDTHPDTGAVCLCSISDPSAWRAVETYILRDGTWQAHGCGGELVLTRPPTHAQIEGWRAQAAA